MLLFLVFGGIVSLVDDFEVELILLRLLDLNWLVIIVGAAIVVLAAGRRVIDAFLAILLRLLDHSTSLLLALLFAQVVRIVFFRRDLFLGCVLLFKIDAWEHIVVYGRLLHFASVFGL